MPSDNSRGRNSISCSGDSLRRFRDARGWTQAELAGQAGYSERLIRKAESGQPISADTIEILAETLSTPEHPLQSEDLIASAGLIVQGFLGVFLKHGPETAKHVDALIHQDVRIWVAGDRERIPFAGEWPTLEGLDRYFQVALSVIEPVRHSLEDGILYVDGANVMFGGDVTWRAVGSETERTVWQMNHYRVERGKIAEWRNYLDTAACQLLMADFRAANGDLPRA